jgi:ubiquinol-cytochrome c reductase iron-sulfur subunit
VKRLWRWLVALVALLLGGRGHEEEGREPERVVAPKEPDRGAETVVIVALFLAALAAVGFIVIYAIDPVDSRTQLLGIALGLCFALVAGALILIGKRLVPTEEIDEPYPEPENPDEQEEIARTFEESASGLTRKGLLLAAGGAAGTAIGAAALTPALSLGPALDTKGFYETPWRRGRRLVDSDGRPLRAEDITTETFYTAYPEGAKRDKVGSPVVVVRLPANELELPPARSGWAPRGIVAYSKVCTHAACAVSLYRKPTFPTVQPRRALVCPCHYSTFDPATGGSVIFGPAGRPLPQLPLLVDDAGELRAAGNFSAPVGPSWSGVRSGEPT